MKKVILMLAGIICLGAGAQAQTQEGNAQDYHGPVLMQGLRGNSISFYIHYPNYNGQGCLYVTPRNPSQFDPVLAARAIELINFNGLGWASSSNRFATRLRPRILRNRTIVYPLQGENLYVTRVLIRNVSPSFNSIAQVIDRASGAGYNGGNPVFLEHKPCP